MEMNHAAPEAPLVEQLERRVKVEGHRPSTTPEHDRYEEEMALVDEPPAKRLAGKLRAADADVAARCLKSAALAVADALPNGQHRLLAGQTHDIVPEATGPMIEVFFTGSAPPAA